MQQLKAFCALCILAGAAMCGYFFAPPDPPHVVFMDIPVPLESAIQVTQGLSEEAFVISLYHGMYGRSPEPWELEHQVGGLKNGNANFCQMVRNMLRSNPSLLVHHPEVRCYKDFKEY